MCKLYEILLIYKKHYLVNVLNWKRECYLLIHERYSKPVARELQKHYIDLDPVTKRKPRFFWLEYNVNDQTLFTCNICINLLFCSIYKRARGEYYWQHFFDCERSITISSISAGGKREKNHYLTQICEWKLYKDIILVMLFGR